MRLTQLIGRELSDAERDCIDSLDPGAPSDYRELAAFLACDWLESRTQRVGIGGGQGAGKSTLGTLIESACSTVGLRACILSLDDFYLTRRDRQQLANRVHPLFETRGPPGTHDVARCRDAMLRLADPERVALPVFDKGLDDRSGERSVDGPFDVVVLEGWCVGAEGVDDSALANPVNDLERVEDPETTWRRFANQQLETAYSDLWATLDEILFLEVPNLGAVRRWRKQQEESLPLERRLGEDEIDRFVEHYERVTRWMLTHSPERADRVVRLGEDHSVLSISSGKTRETLS